MKTRQVANFRFYEVRFSLVRQNINEPPFERLVVCHVGTAYMPSRLLDLLDLESGKRPHSFKNRVLNFIRKTNVFPVYYLVKNSDKLVLSKSFPEDYEERISNSLCIDTDPVIFPLTTSFYDCDRCNSKAGDSCVTGKGRRTQFHKTRLEKAKQPFFIGERSNGKGGYYYYRSKLYVSESAEDVIQYADEVSKKEDQEQSSRSRERIPDDVQIFVWNRDGGRCVKCGTNENLAYDHIIPFSRGGSNTKRNLQILCDSCNSKKGNKIGG